MMSTLVPEVLLEAQESREAAKTSSTRKRKTSGYLGLESHFMQTPGSRSDPQAQAGSDWLIFLQTRNMIGSFDW